MSVDEARPVKSVNFVLGSGGSVSSPEKPSFSQSDDEDGHSHATSTAKTASIASSSRRRSSRSSPAPAEGIHWKAMWENMKADGWTHMTGWGLIAWIYVHPTWAGRKKHELQNEGKDGVDYFSSEESLKRYARRHLNWKSSDPEDLDSANSPKDAEMADRIKKRKRTASKPQPEQAPVKPTEAKTVAKAKKSQAKSASAKANEKKPSSSGPTFKSLVSRAKASYKAEQLKLESQQEEEKASMAKKSASKKKAPPTPESQEESSDDEESRFSEDVSRDPFSFTSENEADTSVERSARKEKSYSKNDEGSENDGSSHDENMSKESASPSEESSLDATYQILPSRTAWEMLMEHFGFTFHAGNYCYPGKENRPGKDSDATLGTNYFASIEDLRKHLCAWGLPEATRYLENEEEIALSRWVRYAHVVGLSDGALINPADIGEPLGFQQAWKMLQKFGCKYGGSGYRVPNFNPCDTEIEFLKILARFGLPRVDGVKSSEILNAGDRLMLDLFIVDADVDTL